MIDSFPNVWGAAGSKDIGGPGGGPDEVRRQSRPSRVCRSVLLFHFVLVFCFVLFFQAKNGKMAGGKPTAQASLWQYKNVAPFDELPLLSSWRRRRDQRF